MERLKRVSAGLFLLVSVFVIVLPLVEAPEKFEEKTSGKQKSEIVQVLENQFFSVSQPFVFSGKFCCSRLISGIGKNFDFDVGIIPFTKPKALAFKVCIYFFVIENFEKLPLFKNKFIRLLVFKSSVK